MPEKLVIDIAAETVQRFRQVWEVEKVLLPFPASAVKAIDGHASTCRITTNLHDIRTRLKVAEAMAQEMRHGETDR